jgi:uncharacterized protein YdeI (YjbR/CyaY-like superfamily)
MRLPGSASASRADGRRQEGLALATTDPRVDAYIEGAAPFARPVLEALRNAVHAGCPDVVETIKWRMPFFSVDGRLLAHMAAFKSHCAFGFWRGNELADRGKNDEAMGQFGRIESVAGLPPRRELVALVKRAFAASDAGPTKKSPPKQTRRPSPPLPESLANALRSEAGARACFDQLSDSQRRDYIEWISEAKRDETRARRVAQAIEWLSAGKTRNWKYETR